MPNETPVNEAAAAENAAVNTVSLNNLSPADNADAEPEKKPPLSRLIILLLLPANLLWALPIYAFTRSGHDMSWQTFNYIFLVYTAVFLLIYGIISYKLYPKISGKALLLANIFNLCLSLVINFILDGYLPRWQWFFYALSSTQNLLIIWVLLLPWQWLARFLAWIKYSDNPENTDTSGASKPAAK